MTMETDYHANNTCYYDFWENEVSQTGIGGTHNTELLNNRAIDLVEAHDPATPLFLYMSYPNAHLPLQVPQELYERHNETLGDIPNNDRRDFAALMLNVDEAVANLTIALRRTGLYDGWRTGARRLHTTSTAPAHLAAHQACGVGTMWCVAPRRARTHRMAWPRAPHCAVVMRTVAL